MAVKQAKVAKKRHTRRRKSRRTDAGSTSSSSSSSSSSDESSSGDEVTGGKPDKKANDDVLMKDGRSSSPEASEQQPQKPTPKFSEEDFSAWYLQRITSELGEDLNKIRSAGDFKESSLPVVVNALQQGSSLFSKEEKQRIMASK